MSLEELKRIVRPPEQPLETGSAADWRAAEERFGGSFPSDYRRFIETYGTVCIGKVLYVLNMLTQFDDALFQLESNRFVYDDDDSLQDWFPFAFHPETPGLFPCGRNLDGTSYFYWITAGPPDEWPVAIVHVAGDYDYEKYACNLTSLLVQLLKREIECPFQPEPDLSNEVIRTYRAQREEED